MLSPFYSREIAHLTLNNNNPHGDILVSSCPWGDEIFSNKCYLSNSVIKRTYLTSAYNTISNIIFVY